MAVSQIADVIVPSEFTSYVVENSMLSTALYQSGVLVKNGLIQEQLALGSNNFVIPYWKDLGEAEALISSDDPTVLSTPQKFSANRQIVRKNCLNQSWSEMSLAGELAGSDPIVALRDRVSAYWNRQYEKRLIASLIGILNSNVANNAGDMVIDISGGTGSAAQFNGISVINAAATLGDELNSVKAIAMHSHVYQQALINDEVEFIPNSQGEPIKTYKGMAVAAIDDNLTISAGIYLTVLFGAGAVGFGASEPNTGFGTEIFRGPSSGNGGGQTTLYSRTNVAVHPLGYAWSDGSGGSAIAGDSPSLTELTAAAHWQRVATSRKSVPLAFLVTK
jgi:hypothetical protein